MHCSAGVGCPRQCGRVCGISTGCLGSWQGDSTLKRPVCGVPSGDILAVKPGPLWQQQCLVPVAGGGRVETVSPWERATDSALCNSERSAVNAGVRCQIAFAPGVLCMTWQVYVFYIRTIHTFNKALCHCEYQCMLLANWQCCCAMYAPAHPLHVHPRGVLSEAVQ